MHAIDMYDMYDTINIPDIHNTSENIRLLLQRGNVRPARLLPSHSLNNVSDFNTFHIEHIEHRYASN